MSESSPNRSFGAMQPSGEYTQRLEAQSSFQSQHSGQARAREGHAAHDRDHSDNGSLYDDYLQVTAAVDPHPFPKSSIFSPASQAFSLVHHATERRQHRIFSSDACELAWKRSSGMFADVPASPIPVTLVDALHAAGRLSLLAAGGTLDGHGGDEARELLHTVLRSTARFARDHNINVEGALRARLRELEREFPLPVPRSVANEDGKPSPTLHDQHEELQRFKLDSFQERETPHAPSSSKENLKDSLQQTPNKFNYLNPPSPFTPGVEHIAPSSLSDSRRPSTTSSYLGPPSAGSGVHLSQKHLAMIHGPGHERKPERDRGDNETSSSKPTSNCSFSATPTDSAQPHGAMLSTQCPFWAVKRGRKPGIYTSAPDLVAQVSGYPNPLFFAATTRAEAEAYLAQAQSSPMRSRTSTLPPSQIAPRPLIEKERRGDSPPSRDDFPPPPTSDALTKVGDDLFANRFASVFQPPKRILWGLNLLREAKAAGKV